MLQRLIECCIQPDLHILQQLFGLLHVIAASRSNNVCCRCNGKVHQRFIVTICSQVNTVVFQFYGKANFLFVVHIVVLSLVGGCSVFGGTPRG